MATNTIRHALYAAIVVGVLALSGMFASFEGREVIEDRLPLNSVTLALMVGAPAFWLALRARREDKSPMVTGVIAALIVGGVLALLVVLESAIDLTFVFPNLIRPIRGALLFGQSDVVGLLLLIGVSAAIGAAAGGLVLLPERARRAIVLTLGVLVVVGLLEGQIRAVMSLPDALVLALAFGLGVVASRVGRRSVVGIAIGPAAGAILGVLLSIVVGGGALQTGGWLRGVGTTPIVLALTPVLLIAVLALTGAAGAASVSSTPAMRSAAAAFVLGVLTIGVLNWQSGMNDLAALLIVAMLLAAFWLLSAAGSVGEVDGTAPAERAWSSRTILIAGGVVLLALPLFAGLYITDVLNLVGLYVILGIGLNIVVGYAGLLNLGFVAFFAIGAYTLGLLTTPSLLTCGGVPPDQITPENVTTLCTGIMSFWGAWPIAALLSALGGMLLGIPVLRLRGDYFAIVTLGFGEIIRLLVRFDDFKPLFGSAQGIADIPRPVIDLTALNPAWRIELLGSTGVYYLILAGILIAAWISTRLAGARLGRAWLAMRADEDVAQATGVNLVRIKLLAFAISGAFAGMAGAIAATRLFGAYPDSFTLIVSINVLSVIIIGGLGSLPGIVVGALVLVGLPEALRELADYRLLAFGALLVATMLLKPQGLIPPSVRRLSDKVQRRAAVPARES